MPEGAITVRDRLGETLRTRWVAALELMIVPLMLWLQASGVVAKPKLPLLLIGWLSMWLRRRGWRQTGMSRPTSWGTTITAAVLIGIAYNALDIGVILPLLHRLTGESLDLSAFASIQGDAATLALMIANVWVSAAFLEEMLYRGYILNRLTDVVGRSAAGWAAAVTLVSLAFGLAHHAQGVTGVMDNVLAGLLFAGLYLASRRNLWLPILVHGVIDTTSVLLLYLGYHP